MLPVFLLHFRFFLLLPQFFLLLPQFFDGYIFSVSFSRQYPFPVTITLQGVNESIEISGKKKIKAVKETKKPFTLFYASVVSILHFAVSTILFAVPTKKPGHRLLGIPRLNFII